VSPGEIAIAGLVAYHANRLRHPLEEEAHEDVQRLLKPLLIRRCPTFFILHVLL
jgi:hypothetical protein